MARVDILLGRPNTANFDGAGTQYVVKTPTGVYYMIYRDGAPIRLCYKKSTDGVTWGAAVEISSLAVTNLAIWYDRWSSIAAGLIHIAYTGSATDDTFYRNLDTESSDTVSAEKTVFAGASTLAGGALSICRARGGNIYVKTMIDAGTEGGFFRSVDVGVNWTSRTDSEALATTDQWIMVPGWAADNQDMMCFFYDASALGLSRYLYDDSANSWAESAIIADGSITLPAATTNFGHFAAAVDITNSRNLLVAWSVTDLANADLQCFHVTESAITEVTNVVLNSTDDQGFCAIGIDTDTEDWYVFYGGLADGSETFASALSINYKKSTDDGATWGAQTPLDGSFSGLTGAINYLYATPRFNTDYAVAYQNAAVALFINTKVPATGGGSGGGSIFGAGGGVIA